MENLVGAKVEIENWAVNNELISKSKKKLKSMNGYISAHQYQP
jgi:hypothetical protein